VTIIVLITIFLVITVGTTIVSTLQATNDKILRDKVLSKLRKSICIKQLLLITYNNNN